jgi:CDP-diacylglycerol---glycerol-3-phosphate 3-phosphatidyltransferase
VADYKLNLPNTITVARIAAAPLIAFLPFSTSPWLRLLAFVLFVTAAVTDIFDGWLARSRNMVTDLGRLLDPLADKLLLFATLIPMFVLMAPAGDAVAGLLGLNPAGGRLQFVTPFGQVALPWWVVTIILAREIFMTLFRQAAVRRGVVISASGLGKLKTGFQSTWIGASYFWFFAATFNQMEGWHPPSWGIVSLGVGVVGVITMFVAVVLTIYSLWVYVDEYRKVFR